MAGILFLACVASSAKAGVIIYFSEVGGNVVATTSGSILLQGEGRLNEGGPFTFGSEYQLLWFDGLLNEWDFGTFTSSGLQANPDTAQGDAFGYSATWLTAPATASGEFFPQTTFEWFERTLNDIGLGYLTTTPFTVYDLNGQTISFATAVPEPSSCAALIGVFVLGFGVLRRRR